LTLAIMSALLDEQRGLLAQLSQPQRVKRAGRTFWCGQWAGQDVVLVLSRVGKVAAATTTTALIEAFDVKNVLFTGVAGGVGHGVKVGDVVVAEAFIQHDLNSAPLFPRYEIPLYGRSALDCDPVLSALLLDAAKLGLAGMDEHFHRSLLLQPAKVHRGLIASGDQFVCDPAVAALLRMTCRRPATSRWRSRWRVLRWPRCVTTMVCLLPPCAPSQTVPMPRRTWIFLLL